MLSIFKKKERKKELHTPSLSEHPASGYSIENQTDRTRERSRVLEGTTLDWFGL